MTYNFKIQRMIAFLLNAIIIGIILSNVLSSDSDKSPIIFMVFYSILFFLNLMIMLILKGFKLIQARIFKETTIVLFTLFIPLIIFISEY